MTAARATRQRDRLRDPQQCGPVTTRSAARCASARADRPSRTNVGAGQHRRIVECRRRPSPRPVPLRCSARTRASLSSGDCRDARRVSMPRCAASRATVPRRRHCTDGHARPSDAGRCDRRALHRRAALAHWNRATARVPSPSQSHRRRRGRRRTSRAQVASDAIDAPSQPAPALVATSATAHATASVRAPNAAASGCRLVALQRGCNAQRVGLGEAIANVSIALQHRRADRSSVPVLSNTTSVTRARRSSASGRTASTPMRASAPCAAARARRAPTATTRRGS